MAGTGFGDLAGMLGQAGLGRMQQGRLLGQQSAMGQQALSQFANNRMSVPLCGKDRTILEELQHETDVWLKDIDL